jgi:hypothetical protein
MLALSTSAIRSVVVPIPLLRAVTTTFAPRIHVIQPRGNVALPM